MSKQGKTPLLPVARTSFLRGRIDFFTTSQWMRRAGLGDAPRTVLQEFAKIKSGDVVLPACGRNAQVSKTIRLRCVTTPNEAQKLLLNRLGLTLPRRLRRIDEVIQM